MKTWRSLLNVACILALTLGLVSNPSVAANAQQNAAQIQAAHLVSQPVAEEPVSAVLGGLSDSEWTSVQAQIEAAAYQVSWQRSGGKWAYRAPNRAQGFDAAFASTGFSASAWQDGQEAWSFGLALLAYGGQPVEPAEMSANKAQVTAVHGPAITEWYENTPEGIKHGLTLNAPPETGALSLDFALSGSLQAEQSSGGLLLNTAERAAVLAYDGLAVYDAAGRSLPASMALTQSGLRISIDSRSAVYPLTVDPLLHTETKILHASNAQALDWFGASVAMDNDTLVVGAPGSYLGTYPGKAFVFERNQGGADAWGEVKVLLASDGQVDDAFGCSVAISGDTIVIGAENRDIGAPEDNAGAAYIFQRNTGGADAWGEVITITATDSQAGDYFGAAVAIDGDVIAVGAPREDGGVGDPNPDAGEIYVFYRHWGGFNAWGQARNENAWDGQAWDMFGSSVSLEGDLLVVGAPFEDGGPGDPLLNAGAAYILERSAGGPDSWNPIKTLVASDAQADDWFGAPAVISGDTIVVGADGEDGGAGDPMSAAGAAYVFQGGVDAWVEVAILHASDAQADDWFGHSVALDGDTIVVGAPNEDGGPGNPITSQGAAYVFERNQGGPSAWGEVNILHASDAQTWDGFGISVAVSGNRVLAGAQNEDGGAGDPLGESGAAYLFSASGTWLEAISLHASDAQAGDSFGFSVSMDGDTLVVGAPNEDGGLGNDFSNAGAAYVLQRNQGGTNSWGEVLILRASDAQMDDQFGRAVAVEGDTIVVGAPYEDGGIGDPATDAGAVYLFSRNLGGPASWSEPNSWGEMFSMHASDMQAGDSFGWAVAVDGNTLVVSSPFEDGGVSDLLTDTGATYVYSYSYPQAWIGDAILHASDAQINDQFGFSVALDENTVVVGAPYEDGGAGDTLIGAGAAYIFQRDQGDINGWGEVTIQHASDAQTADQFGRSVSISGDTFAAGAPYEDGGPGDPLSDTGAAYVFSRNQGGGNAWGEVTNLRSIDAQAYDEFGSVVALDHDTLVASSLLEDGGPGDPLTNTGTAYVFSRNQGGSDAWGQVRTLHALDAQAGDNLGSVAISGNTLVTGAYNEDGGLGDPAVDAGTAYIFTLQSGWEPEPVPLPSEIQIGDLFGSVALSGNTLVVGAPDEDGGAGDPLPAAGAAYVFYRGLGGMNNWVGMAVLRASDAQAGDNFGWAVGIYSDTVVIGAPNEDGGTGNLAVDAGAAYIFQRNQGGTDAWDEVTILRAADAQADDHFGYSVSINGSTIIVGAPGEDGGPGDPLLDAGAAYVFGYTPPAKGILTPSGWDQEGTLGAGPGAGAGDEFGSSVALNGPTLAVGAPGEDGGPGNPLPDAGAAYVFRHTPPAKGILAPNGWDQEGTLGAGPGAGEGDQFGSSMALDGTTLAVGAPFEDGGVGNPITNTGAAYVFEFVPPVMGMLAPSGWDQEGTLGAGPEAGEGDAFGSSMSISGEALIIGAPLEDGGPGNPITDTGAAYLFTLNPLPRATASWGGMQTLRSMNSQVGDRFGSLVSLENNTVAIGAPYTDGSPTSPITDTGAAYVFDLVLPNAAPIGINDSLRVIPNSVGNILDVLGNDSDANGDLLLITAVSTPTHGTALNLGLTVLYTPVPSFMGTDSFTYTITDGNGGYTTATVYVAIGYRIYLPEIIRK